ncbi:MAG: hypothetical protein R2932_55465 [Caldilineaceae bacterium]
MLTQRGNLVQTIMVNVTVLMAVAGIVILIANNLATIPAQLYITVFATLALVLTLAGLLTGRRGHANSTAILGGYAGIVLGLAIFAGSHFYGFATFIPDQLLLWMAGLTLLAFLFASTWQMGLVGLLNLVWLYTAFLYGTSYWPGVILNACLYWFAWQRRTTVALFLLAVANSVVLINLYGYDLVHPNHFPLTFATVHLVVTFACFGMLSGLAGITWRNIPPWSPWLRYSQALIWLTTVAGIGLLLFLITPNSWMIINQSYDGGLFAIVLGMALYMISAVFVFSRPTMPGTRTRFGLWTIGFLLLISGLNKMVMPFAFQEYMTLILALLGIGVGLGVLWGAGKTRSLPRLLLGLVTVVTSTTMLMMEWSTGYRTDALIFLTLALIKTMMLLWMQRRPRPVAVAPTVPIAGRRVREVAA